MNERTVAVIDYGVGNLSSVCRTLNKLGYRTRVSREFDVLDRADLLLLPGVGAFPVAMTALHRYDLVEYLQRTARQGRPIVGICLGMQLFADSSTEHGNTAGLGIIPGEVTALPDGQWHIGWNTIEVQNGDSLLQPSDGQALYFNHSYVFDTPKEFRTGLSRLPRPFPAAVRRGNVVGLQFHPEKSQGAGRQVLRNVIEGMSRA